MSSNHRFIKFWPQDWQRDPALRSCGVAARGLWIDLICIMHEGTPYGHLTINERAVTTRQIGTLTGVGEKEAIRLLTELEEAGVFSRSEDGVIFSRRMVRDNVRSLEGRANIERRWADRGNDSDPQSQPSHPPTSQPDTPPIRGVDSLESESRRENQKQEARKKETPKPPSGLGPNGVCEPEGFREFWAKYPRKDDKGHARTAFARAAKKASVGSILAGLEQYPFQREFLPLPATWLNGERWLTVEHSEPATQAVNGKSNKYAYLADAWNLPLPGETK